MNQIVPLQLLIYEYVADMRERRAQHRDAHLAHVKSWRESDKLKMAGATGDPPAGALFVFDVEDPAEIDRFVSEDPYVESGLVTDWRVDCWNVVR